MKIGVIDYGVGNIANLLNCLDFVVGSKRGVAITLIDNPLHLEGVDRVILPGVGAFKTAMDKLVSLGMDKAVIDFSESGKYVLGICLGLQLLFKKSSEFVDCAGLGLLDGEVRGFVETLPPCYRPRHSQGQRVASYDDTLLPSSCEGGGQISGGGGLKVPHVGWNTNDVVREHAILEGLPAPFYLYFTHSYHAVCNDEVVVATCNYGTPFPSIVSKGNVMGIQAHPEKSHNAGLKIMENFVNMS